MSDRVFATVGAVYADGVTLIFDGETEAAEKRYKCNTGVVFHAGDRVKICADSGTYVVEYVVGAPAAEPGEVTVDRLTNGTKTVTLTTSALVPGGASLTLGSVSAPWYGFYTGAGDTRLCAFNGRLGFFDAAPVARKTLSTVTDNQGYTAATADNYLHIINNLVGILKAHGLIST